jgi:hypothetical protein
MNTFVVMGVAPLIGRVTGPADGAEGAEAVTVLGYKFWQHVFGADASVIGRKLVLNGKPRRIIGVMPPPFMWRGAEVYLPDMFHRGQDVEGEKRGPPVGPSQAEHNRGAGRSLVPPSTIPDEAQIMLTRPFCYSC